MAGELTTANYGWVKPTVGSSVDAWGGYINTDLDGIDSTVKSVSNAIPAASLTTPAMDGTAAVGTGTTFARADHIHPSDTSRYAATNPSGYQTAAQSPRAARLMHLSLQPDLHRRACRADCFSRYEYDATGDDGVCLCRDRWLGSGQPQSPRQRRHVGRPAQ